MTIIYILIGILGLGILMFVHELGHYTLAKLNDVKVLEFSIGMGPKIIQTKRGETEYTLRILPFGAYVKMEGEEEESDNERSFSKKSPWQRLSIILAGAAMNLILPLILFTIMAFSTSVTTTKVDDFAEKSPARESGIEVGDKIVSINGKKISIFEQITTSISESEGKEIEVVAERDNKKSTYSIKPIEEKGSYYIGIKPKVEKIKGIGESLSYAYHKWTYVIDQVFYSFKVLITGKVSLDQVGGPITIVKVSAQAAQSGFWSYIYLISFISINLGIFNLFPIPALDGGWTVLLIYEIITRRKPNEKFVSTINTIGFSLLIVLMVVILLKDIFFPVIF